MLQAMLQASYMHSDQQRYSMHDWLDHQGHICRYAKKAKEMAAARWSAKDAASNAPSNPPSNASAVQCSAVQGKSNTPQPPNGEIESIYAAYPRKVGKPPALRAIRKAVGKYGVQAILDATLAYAKSQVDADPQFIPYPSTWFNQERFNDDPTTWVHKQVGTDIERLKLKQKALQGQLEAIKARGYVDAFGLQFANPVDASEYREVKAKLVEVQAEEANL